MLYRFERHNNLFISGSMIWDICCEDGGLSGLYNFFSNFFENNTKITSKVLLSWVWRLLF